MKRLPETRPVVYDTALQIWSAVVLYKAVSMQQTVFCLKAPSVDLRSKTSTSFTVWLWLASNYTAITLVHFNGQITTMYQCALLTDETSTALLVNMYILKQQTAVDSQTGLSVDRKT